MTYIKICGMRRTDDIINANRVRPDFVGFIFHHSSRRFISAYMAARLRYGLDNDIGTVGVFKNESVDIIKSFCESDVIDWIQLQGDEDNAFIKDVRAVTGKKVVQAFSPTEDGVRLASESEADLVMFVCPKRFDGWWQTEHIRDVGRDFVISGGITPENVGSVIKTLRPYGVDVSTGVELDASKNWAKMNAFVTAVHECDRSMERFRSERPGVSVL